MRRVLPTSVAGLTFSVVLVPALIVAPTITRPFAPRPHAVAPSLQHLGIAGVDRAALSSLGRTARTPLALTPARSTARFSLVGITWDARDALTPVDVQVRTRSQGVWTGWHDLDGLDDVEADPGSKDAVGEQDWRAGTAPYWVGPSDGVQVRVDGNRLPRGLRVDLVDPGSSDADATAAEQGIPAASASAEVAQPTIVTRKGWGADESLRDGSPDYADPLKVGFVHHTDTANSYTASQSASIVRSIYAYHTKSRGWSDIGYNFLVDKYGTVFEGRYGGIDRAVVGAHTGGFNSHSFAASLMGNYAEAQPSGVMMSSLAKLFAWKLGRSYLDPQGTGTLVSAGGGTSRYSEGTAHTFNVISGHRDAGYTACPGTYAYGKLGSLRTSVQALMGPSFVLPSAAPASRGLLEPGGFTVRAGAVNPLTWTLTVTNVATGLVVRTVSGSASRATPVSAVWDRLDDQQAVAPPGRYALRLNATDATGKSARPWSTQVTITSPVTLEAPTVGGWNASVPVKGSARSGSAVQLEVMPKGTTEWLPVGTATADSDGRWASAFTLTDDTDVRATTSDYPSEIRRVRVAPLFTTSSPNEYGDTLTLTGSARPGTTVAVKAKPVGSTTWGASQTVTADVVTGAWSFQLPMDREWDLQASADGVSTPIVTVYVTVTLDALPTYIGTLGSSVPVSGTGAPGVAIALQVQRVGTTTWSTVASAVPDSAGRWSAGVPLSDDLTVRARVHGLNSGGRRTAQVRPMATAPATAGWNTSVPLRGTARPGSAVVVSRKVGSTTTTVSTTASSAGAWAAPFVIGSTTSWWATSNDLSSTVGSTAVAPTLVAPTGSAVPGVRVAVRGTARPGSQVSFGVRQPGASSFSWLSVGPADSAGRWASTFLPARAGTVGLQASAASVLSPVLLSPVAAATVRAPVSGRLGGAVALSGAARPGVLVRVQTKLRTATSWVTAASVSATSAGAWRASFALRDDTSVRAVTTDGTSTTSVVKVGPTLTAPTRARVGTTIRISGTARPGAKVAVYIRYASEPRALFRRAATASSTGAWSVSWPFTRWIESHAISNGLRSVTRATSAQ